MPNRAIIVLRSLVALALAIVAIPLVNLAGGELAGVLALPAGGDARLGYDLLWVFLAGLVGSALMVGIAAVARTAHAWAIFAIYLVLDVYVTVVAWNDFPRWFTLACLLTLPAQVWLGWWLAWGRRRGPARPA
ncbi:MAG: hypothetical protein C0521_13220 [Xanthomonas sp.]|nr:hypothetical protein [Xanthomonas sp.]